MTYEILIFIMCVVAGCGLAKSLFGINVLEWLR